MVFEKEKTHKKPISFKERVTPPSESHHKILLVTVMVLWILYKLQLKLNPSHFFPEYDMF